MTNGNGGRRPAAGQRVDAVESRTSNLEAWAAEQRAQHTALADDVGSMRQELASFMGEVRRYMQTSGRTNWGVLTGFGTLLLGIAALAASPFATDLRSVEDEVGILREVIAKTSSSRWTREDHEAFRYALEQRTRDQRAELLELMRSADGDLADRLHELLARYEAHVENGHPHTVVERLERAEDLIDEVRTRLLDVERAPSPGGD